MPAKRLPLQLLATLLIASAAAATECGSRSDLQMGPQISGYEAAPGDAGPEATSACSPQSPFGAPQAVQGTNLNTGFVESGLRLSQDELAGYFSSDRGEGGLASYDIYLARRANIEAPFQAPQRLDGLHAPNSAADSPSITSNSLALYYFGGCGDAFAQGKLCLATRSVSSSPFGDPMPVFIPGHFGLRPFVIDDGLTVYFDAYSASAQVGVTRRASTSESFGQAAPVTIIGVPAALAATVYSPVTDDGEEVLYFAIGATAHIWMALRSGANEFNLPVPLSQLDSAEGEIPTWISPDGCRLYFTRLVSDDAGPQSDLFVATRMPP